MKEYVYERPKLNAKQVAAFFEPKDAAGNVARYSWIEGSTKSGKTVSCVAWLFEQALLYGKPGREFWWVAPISGTAKIAYGRIKRGAPPGLLRSNDTELTLTNTINGSVSAALEGHKDRLATLRLKDWTDALWFSLLRQWVRSTPGAGLRRRPRPRTTICSASLIGPLPPVRRSTRCASRPTC